jgi:hypothetical protein
MTSLVLLHLCCAWHRRCGRKPTALDAHEALQTREIDNDFEFHLKHDDDLPRQAQDKTDARKNGCQAIAVFSPQIGRRWTRAAVKHATACPIRCTPSSHGCLSLHQTQRLDQKRTRNYPASWSHRVRACPCPDTDADTDRMDTSFNLKCGYY